MTAITLTLTDLGLDALAAAMMPGGDPVVLSEVGLTAQNFVAAPTLIALPGEFLRLPVSGRSLDDAIVHMVAEDATAATWTVKGIGVYRDDGTLFGTYDHTDAPHNDVLVSKAAPAVALIAFDLVFQSGEATLIDFGPASFSYPPATEAEKGVAKIATQALTNAAVDDYTIVTPKKLDVRLAAFLATVNAALAGFGNRLDALLARTITGTGLATGGGNLTASREIAVAKSSAIMIRNGVNDTTAMTPKAFRDASPATNAAQGGCIHPDGRIEKWGSVTGVSWTEGTHAVAFPEPFPTECWQVQISELGANNIGADYWMLLNTGSVDANGFSARVQGEEDNGVPIGGLYWRAIGI